MQSCSMECPVCHQKLTRAPYESVRIYQCNQCGGHLLSKSKLRKIEKLRTHSKSKLLNEINSATSTDNQQKLRCPECHFTMEHRFQKIGASNFRIENCPRCLWIWLDDGELAKLQILYETSDAGKQSEASRKRFQNMTDQEKKELDDRIAKLPNYIPNVGYGRRNFLENMFDFITSF